MKHGPRLVDHMEWTTDELRGVMELIGLDYNQRVGRVGEDIVEEILKRLGIPFEVTPSHHPVDFIVPGAAFEVKTLLHNKTGDIVISKKDRPIKKAWCKDHGLEGYVIALHCTACSPEGEWRKAEEHKLELLYREGFKRHPLRTMGYFQELLWELLERLDLVEKKEEVVC